MHNEIFSRCGAGLRRIGVPWLVLLSVAAACSDDVGGPGTGPGRLPDEPESPPIDLTEGQRLFDHETFGGNGRSCVTCHMRETGTITLAAVVQRLTADLDDELFLHDALDDGHAGTSRIAAHATIRVELQLPGYVTLADNPSQRTIVVSRGVPTTLNTPALDGKGLVALMYDLRDPDLQQQALGAIRGHARSTVEPTRAQLDAIAAFQQQDERFFSSAALLDFASGRGPRPELPEGRTESERRGRLFFLDAPLTQGSKEGVCGMCHSGALLNEVNQFGETETGIRAGAKFHNVLVAESNALRNPTFRFLVDGPGGARQVVIADPGIMLTSTSRHVGSFVPPNLHPAQLAGFFKTPSLWGVKHTPPYFHDNSAKTLREVVDHYADVLFRRVRFMGEFIELTEEERQDIVAFLERL